MNRIRRGMRRAGRGGAAMVTVLLLVLLVPLIGGGLMLFAQRQAYSASLLADQIRAKAIAEAGANVAYSLLITNFAARSNNAYFPSTNYAGGTYDVGVKPVGSLAAVIYSTGRYDQAVARVVLDIINEREETYRPPPTSPWYYTIFVNGYIDDNGNGTVFGDVHGNSTAGINGGSEWGSDISNCNVEVCDTLTHKGNGGIHGTVKAPRFNLSGPKHFHEQITTNVARITFPEIDLTPYYNIAASNGQVYAGGKYNSDVGLGVIPGGVRWFNGDVEFKKNCSFTGCIIATGSITFNGGLTTTRVGYLPAIVSRDSEILINGAHTINGLVYSKGDTRMNGAGLIDGTVVVGGNFRLNGSYGIVSYRYSEPGLPGEDPLARDRIMISAWQE